MDKKFKGFVIIALVVLFVGMAAGGFYIVKRMSGDIQPAQGGQGVYDSKNMQIFQLAEPITTNIVSETEPNATHIIKVTVGFGVNKTSRDFKEIAKEFEEKEMLVRDEVIQSLRDQSYEKMAKSDAQSQLSEVIISRISTLLMTQAIEGIYFGDFFVQ